MFQPSQKMLTDLCKSAILSPTPHKHICQFPPLDITSTYFGGVRGLLWEISSVTFSFLATVVDQMVPDPYEMANSQSWGGRGGTRNFPTGADSSDEGAKICTSGYYKCQKSPKKSRFTFRRGS